MNTSSSPREYRIIARGVARPWKADLASAVGRHPEHLWHTAEWWPNTWTVFALDHFHMDPPGCKDPEWPDPASDQLPETLAVAGETCLCRECTLPDHGWIDLTALFGGAYAGRMARAYAWLDLPEDREFRILTSADWSHRWWVNGSLSFEVKGNGGGILDRTHLWSLSLPKGRHLLCLDVTSGSGGWGFAHEAYLAPSSPLTLPGGTTLESRQPIPPVPAEAVSVSYHFPEANPGRLSTGTLPLPPETACSFVDGLPAEDFKNDGYIHREWNEADSRLLVQSTVLPHTRFRESSFFKREPDPDLLIPLRASDNELRFGPLWILQSEDRLVCSFRTRIPAAVTLTLPHRSIQSEKGLIHHIEVNGPFDPGPLPYRLSHGETQLFSGEVHPPSATEPCLLIAGDPAPGTEQWRRTAQSLTHLNPDALLLLGDVVSSGKKEALWQESFYEPAKDLLSGTPLACVFGNHDQQSGLLTAYFPQKITHDLWSITLGNSRWIGLYSGTPVPGDETAAQLEKMLQTHVPGIPVCFCSHYPPYSSSNHGGVDGQNRPTEPACRYAREVLLPLLSRWGVRAWFTGHNHVYERSVLPGGLQLITTGGAGGYLYGKTGTPRQNPYSTFFRTGYHVCRATIRKPGILLQALDRNGERFDEVSL